MGVRAGGCRQPSTLFLIVKLRLLPGCSFFIPGSRAIEMIRVVLACLDGRKRLSGEIDANMLMSSV